MCVAVVGFSHCVCAGYALVSLRKEPGSCCLRCLVSLSEDLQLFLCPHVYEIALSNVCSSSWAAREQKGLPS